MNLEKDEKRSTSFDPNNHFKITKKEDMVLIARANGMSHIQHAEYTNKSNRTFESRTESLKRRNTYNSDHVHLPGATGSTLMMCEAINYVLDGDERIKLATVPNKISLNHKQAEALGYFLNGYTILQTAQEMVMSEKAVETYSMVINKVTGSKNRIHLAAIVATYIKSGNEITVADSKYKAYKHRRRLVIR